MAIGTQTDKAPFGLLGRTLGHSWSPWIHNLLGSAPYALFEREPEEVANFIRHGTWRGINVTIPYKRNAFELADETSDRAARLGVANTLVRRSDGTVFADNTDVGGFSWMLNRFCRRTMEASAKEALDGAPVLVLGSGGASRAVQAALAECGARASVVSRKGSDNYTNLIERHGDARLVVNTTPVGMYPACPASPLTTEQLSALGHLGGVLDVVYNPARTGLCLAAEGLGIPYESGLAMLVSQAKQSSELFQGIGIDDGEVARIEADLRAQMLNIIIIGMPGVGKTSTGAALAHRLNRPFIDMDDAFELEHGIGAADYIRQKGEPAFRDAETIVLSSYASRSGLVIACGGGVVERPENYRLLHQNGTIVMLDRPIENLSTFGRPVSQAEGVAAIAHRRMGLYRRWADLIVPCTGTPSGDAAEICSKLSW